MREESYVRWAGWFAVVVLVLISGGVVQAHEPLQRLIVKKAPGDRPRATVLFVADEEQPGSDSQGGDKQKKAKVHRDVFILRQPADAAQRFAVDFLEVADQEDEAGGHWIGVMCSDTVDEAIRAHVDLPEGRGLQVLQVVEGSPAAQAGLKKFDILLQVGDDELNDVRTLVDAVKTTGDDELRIEYLHGGQRQTITIRPKKRPKPHVAKVTHANQFRMFLDADSVPKVLREFELNRSPGNAVITRFLRPILAFPADVEYPDDLEVTIAKKGKSPAKIVVQRGEDRWETTDDKLGELPEEVRGHVARLLGRGLSGTVARVAVPSVDEEVDVTVEIATPEDILIEIPDAKSDGDDGKRTVRRRVIRRSQPASDDRSDEDRIERRFRQLDDRLKRLQGLIERMSERLNDDDDDGDIEAEEDEPEDNPTEAEDI